MIRRHGFPLNSKSATMAQRANLKGRLPCTMCTILSWFSKMTRRAGVSRRVLFRGHGEVGAKLKLSTDVTFAPFNLDLLEISSYEISSGYERSIVKWLVETACPLGE